MLSAVADVICNMLSAVADVLHLHIQLLLRFNKFHFNATRNSNSLISMAANLLVFINTPAAANRRTLFGVLSCSYDTNSDINVIRLNLLIPMFLLMRYTV